MKITHLSIKGLKDIPLENLVVIVGANGTGKTRLLSEIHSSFTARKSEVSNNFWDIACDADIDIRDRQAWYNSLVQRIDDKGREYWYCPFTNSTRGHDGIEITSDQYSQFDKQSTGDSLCNDAIYKKELTHYLPVDSRLNITGNTQMQPAKDKTNNLPDLLSRQPAIYEEINKYLKLYFKKELHVILHNAPQIELRLSNIDATPLPEMNWKDRPQSYTNFNAWMKQNNIGNINHEGHGIRAFLNILFTYFLPTNHLLMIDEPEIHLYPSIKRKFGSTIGQLACNGSKQIICVTHDSDFLQGIFDSRCPLTMIRLCHEKETYSSICYTYNNSLRASHNQDRYVQIPFLDFIVIVEGATDRLVYEYIFHDKSLLADKEYKFIDTGGSANLNIPVNFAINLKVPFAIIADFDVLKAEGRNSTPPVARISVVSKDTELHNKIKEVGCKLKGIQNLSNQGIDAITDENLQKEVSTLINKLKLLGIFIISTGGLESWIEIDSSKADYPEKVMELYSKDKNKFDLLASFLDNIGSYIQKRINDLSSD